MIEWLEENGIVMTLIVTIASTSFVYLAIWIPNKILINQAFSDLLREYRSTLMGVSIKRLWEFYENECKGKRDEIDSNLSVIIHEYKRTYYNDNIHRKTTDQLKDRLHFYRRIVSQYYQHLAKLRFGRFVKLSKRKIRKSLGAGAFEIIGIIIPIEFIAIPQLLKRDYPITINKSLEYLTKLYHYCPTVLSNKSCN